MMTAEIMQLNDFQSGLVELAEHLHLQRLSSNWPQPVLCMKLRTKLRCLSQGPLPSLEFQLMRGSE
jgi:hypothetical protein